MRAMRALAATMVAIALAAAPGTATAATPADTSPQGANDWSCVPSAAHPDPVVLVHGLGANMSWNWFAISPYLKRRGFCVYALTYGRDPRYPFPFDQFGGLVPMERSAEELSRFVDRVRDATGAEEVDLVGHSQGTIMPAYYVKFLGGGAKVDDYVALTPLWRGTSLPGGRLAGLIAPFCASCPQFIAGSAFLQRQNAGPDGPVPGVDLTNIVTRYDELVVPYTSGILNRPGVTNIVVQDQCGIDFAEHAALAFDPVAAQDVLNALDPANARPPRCTLVLPFVGAPVR